jgi:AcrR family transcriptional regulator
MSETVDKPLRRDAARNRERILTAAGELFAEHGLATTLNDVARHAGLGVGTVYRHFPDKGALVAELFQTRVDELVAIGEAALADPDPWRGLVGALEGILEHQAADRGLHDLILESPDGSERVGRIRERMLPIGDALIARARAAGAVRQDVTTLDIPLLQLMVGTVLDAGRAAAPQLWRRYLQLVLRGIAAHPEALDLPPVQMDPTVIDAVMASAKRPRR